jgi:hypothetical protein
MPDLDRARLSICANGGVAPPALVLLAGSICLFLTHGHHMCAQHATSLFHTTTGSTFVTAQTTLAMHGTPKHNM